MRHFTPEELAEADERGKAVATAHESLRTARANLVAAALAGVDQTSSRWDMLCENVEAAARRRHQAQEAEDDWWRGKDFNV